MLLNIIQEEINKALESGNLKIWMLLTSYLLKQDEQAHNCWAYHGCGENQMDRPALFGYYETGYMFCNGWTYFNRPKRRKFLESAVFFRRWSSDDCEFFDDHECLRTANGWLECNLFESHENKDWR